MKLILVTGLDGSGKSTFFDRLEKLKHPNVAVIHSPVMDLTKIKSIPTRETALLINELNKHADEKQIPILKAVAIFGAMLIFKELLEECNKEDPDFIFCERHPLIDTGIYARFYAQKLDPEKIPENLLLETDRLFGLGLSKLLDRIPSNLWQENNSPTASICQFIYSHFHENDNKSISQLKDLFQLELPDKIHFLQAEPEILLSRINQRQKLEAHENFEVLQMLNSAYANLFAEIDTNFDGDIEMINANSFDALDLFIENINNRILNPTKQY